MTTALIFGGTFDPVHLGHLLSARSLLELFDDARLIMVPCQIPPHRMLPKAAGTHRLNMLKIAVEDEKSILVDECEVNREGKSYTYDTLTMFRKRWPDARLYFVLGSDSWATLTEWYRWRELTNYAHLAVLARPGQSVIESLILKDWAEPKTLELNQVSAKAGNVVKLRLKQVEISATLIRESLSKRQSVENWLPDKVANYIEKNRLYNCLDDCARKK